MTSEVSEGTEPIKTVKTDANISIDADAVQAAGKLATESEEKMLCGFPLSNVLISVLVCLACFGVGIGIGAVIPGETAECPSTIAPPAPTPTHEATTLTTLSSTTVTEDTKPNNSYFFDAGEIGLLQGIMERKICKECNDEMEHEIVKFLNVPYSEVTFL